METRGKLDHGMILRLLFVMILLATVTALIKSYALKMNASNTTPRLAYQYFMQWHKLRVHQKTLPFILPKKNTGFTVDGWGKSFYMRTDTSILVSAGEDERFHSNDDLHFYWFPKSCPTSIKKWIKDSISKSHFDIENLPSGIIFNPTKQALSNQEGSCNLPDLSGADSFYGSRDDLFKSIYFLEEDHLPPIKKKKAESN